MEVNLNNLYNKGVMNLDNDITFDNIDSSLIRDLKNVHIKGYLKYTITEEIEIALDVKGIMVIPDAITLDDLEHPFAFNISEIFAENDENYANFFKNNKNTLDINEILWENIVLEVPISLTKNQGVSLQGDGWQLKGNTQE